MTSFDGMPSNSIIFDVYLTLESWSGSAGEKYTHVAAKIVYGIAVIEVSTGYIACTKSRSVGGVSVCGMAPPTIGTAAMRSILCQYSRSP